MKMTILNNEKGFALILAILTSVALLVTAMGVLYFIDRSTAMSGAGKNYATAEQAADGAVNLMKDTINLTLWGEPIVDELKDDGTIIDDDPSCLLNSILSGSGACTVELVLPGTVGSQGYTAEITVERLYSVVIPGGRIEFAGSGSSVNSTAVFYQISTKVSGNRGVTAESSVLYRFAG